MSKLKGPRLENEVEKCRAESNWKRLQELLPHCRAKGSGLESLANFLHGEYALEIFLEESASAAGGMLNPTPSNAEELKKAQKFLESVVSSETELKPYIGLEAHLLLAKLHFLCAQFVQAVDHVSKSQLQRQDIQFQTLRTLRLVAEAYAIQGLSLEKLPPSSTSRYQKQQHETQILFCFEKAAELALAYIQELEKAQHEQTGFGGYFGTSTGPATPSVTLSVPSGGSGSTGTVAPNLTNQRPERIEGRCLRRLAGELMETAIQRVPLMQMRASSGAPAQRAIERAVEQYRKTLTATGDKSVAQHLHQKLSRQLAELLLRGVPDGTYTPVTNSSAAAQKAQSLRFYTGGSGYLPQCRSEEVLLLLSVSESLAAREAVLSRATEDAVARIESLENVKAVQNLLTLVLSSLRQYQLLAGLLEKAMKFAYEDRFIWSQFALSLISYGRYSRASSILHECISGMPQAETDPVMLLFAAKTCIEQLREFDKGIEYARCALELCQGGWLSSRAQLLEGLALSMKAQEASSYTQRTLLHKEAIQAFETAVQMDGKDHTTRFFMALQLAIGRELESARMHCEKSLSMQPDQPMAHLLLVLLLTAENRYSEALDLVLEAMMEYPSHYGLLVVRLKLQMHFGKSEQALVTARDLLWFWRAESAGAAEKVHTTKTTTSAAPYEPSLLSAATGTLRSGTIPGSTTQLHPVPSMSAIDLTDRESVLLGAGSAMSEYGGVASTVSDSLGLSGSSHQRSVANRWRQQANIWLELAELFLDNDRLHDVQRCVDEACQLFPNSHQTLYLKARLLQVRASSSPDEQAWNRCVQEAKACLLGSVSILPNHIPSLRQLTALYQMEGNLRMAEKCLKDLVTIDPLEHESWMALGQVLAEEERFSEATECLGTATKLEYTAPILPFTVIPRLVHLN